MIISLGEGLIDFISQSDLDFKGHPGGSPLNCSVSIARQGVKVQYLGRLSTDLFGERLLSHLKANQVGTDLVVRTDDNSTLSFIQKQNDGSAAYAFFAHETADILWDQKELDSIRLPSETRIIHFGSISLTQEPCGALLANFLMNRCSEYLLSFDPNIRPSLVADRGVYMKRFEDLCSISGLVKLSDEDLSWLYPGVSREEAVKMILDLGAGLVALTEGAEGARLFTNKMTVSCALFGLPVVDTIGAGDTFHGALLAYLHKKKIFSKSELSELDHQELSALGNYANKAAGINCNRKGANPPTVQDMEKMTR
jgi:fructokinase